jgi:hypothetical protein
MSIRLCRQCREPIPAASAAFSMESAHVCPPYGVQFFVVPHPDHAKFGELPGKLGVVADVVVVDYAAGR